MTSFRLRFSIGPADERLDVLRMHLHKIHDRRLQSKFLYEVLIFETVNEINVAEISNGSFSIDLIFNELSPGLSYVFAALEKISDHQSRVLWLRRKLISICTGASTSREVTKTRPQMAHGSEQDLSNHSVTSKIASIQALPPELAALNRQAVDQFQSM